MIKQILSFFFVVSLAFGQSAEFLDSTSTADPSTKIEVAVKLDNMVFRYKEPINIKASILNLGEPITISIHPQKGYYNYFVEVFSKDGISVPETDAFFADKFNNLQKTRSIKLVGQINSELTTIKLMPNKILGDQINLADMFDLEPGYYLVRVKFFPDTVIKKPMNYIYSPFVSIIIKPEQKEIDKALDQKQKWEQDKKNLNTPEDSVNAFFYAKAEKNWDKFFYVVDMRQLISIFGTFNTAYNNATSEEKDSILKDFEVYLKDVNKNENITYIDIVETIIKKDQALVKVLVNTQLERRDLKREYVFKLEKQVHWVITAYTVVIR